MIDYIRRLRRKREMGKDMAEEVAKRERKQGEEYKKAKQSAAAAALAIAIEEKNAHMLAKKS